MTTSPLPIDSDVTTAEEAAAYDCWFRAKVQKSLEDQRELTSHDVVMANLRKIIEKHNPDASDQVAS